MSGARRIGFDEIPSFRARSWIMVRIFVLKSFGGSFTFADEELEKLRDDCKELRNLAIIDLLNSMGMRVGELANLDRMDINFDEKECLNTHIIG